MNRWNALMLNHFAGCHLIAEGWDECRQREARAYIIPGDSENFGITDGTDSFIVPVGAGAGGTIFKGVDLRDIVRRFFAGEQLPVARAEGSPKLTRRRLLLDAPEPTPESEPAPSRRRSFQNTNTNSQPTLLRRR